MVCAIASDAFGGADLIAELTFDDLLRTGRLDVEVD